MSQGFGMPPPPAPAAPARPTTVTLATAALLAVAGLYVIGFVMALSIVGTMNEVFEEEFAGTEAEGFETMASGFVVGASCVNLVIAIGLVVLAIFNNKGKNGSRITTWVVAGIALCCNGLGLALSGVDTTGGDVDQAQLERRLEEALPGWYEPASMAILVLSFLGLLAAVILLALPPSNAFFRKRPEDAFEPPPAYPPPGYPPPGQPPQYPPQGGQPPPGPPPPGQPPQYPPPGS